MTTDELLKTLGWSDELLTAHKPTIPDIEDRDDFECVFEPELVATSELIVQFESAVLTSGGDIIFER